MNKDSRFLPGARWRMRALPARPGSAATYPGFLTVAGPTKWKKGHVNVRYVPDDPVAFAADEMMLGWGDLSPWLPRHLELLAEPVEESAEQRVQNLLEVHQAGWIPRPKGTKCDCKHCSADRQARRTRR